MKHHKDDKDMSPDLSKTVRKGAGLGLPGSSGPARGPRSSRMRLLGLVVLLALMGLVLHQFGPAIAKHANPAALQAIFERAVRPASSPRVSLTSLDFSRAQFAICCKGIDILTTAPVPPSSKLILRAASEAGLSPDLYFFAGRL